MSQEKAISILASKLSFHVYTHIFRERVTPYATL